jgi:hypothetical protein
MNGPCAGLGKRVKSGGLGYGGGWYWLQLIPYANNAVPIISKKMILMGSYSFMIQLGNAYIYDG